MYRTKAKSGGLGRREVVLVVGVDDRAAAFDEVAARTGDGLHGEVDDLTAAGRRGGLEDVVGGHRRVAADLGRGGGSGATARRRTRLDDLDDVVLVVARRTRATAVDAARAGDRLRRIDGLRVKRSSLAGEAKGEDGLRVDRGSLIGETEGQQRGLEVLAPLLLDSEPMAGESA